MNGELTTYNPVEVPAVSGESRWAFLDRTPAGWGVSGPGELLAHIAGDLAQQRVESFRDYRPEAVEVKLRAVVAHTEGYFLVGRDTVEGYPEFAAKRPGKVWKKLTGADLFDSFLLGEDAFDNAPDAEVWNALLFVAEKYRINGRELRQLNDAIAVLIALRAGLRVDVARLPNIDPAMVLTGGES